VDDTAHYLIRADGYIGYHAGGTDLHGRYLARWLPNTPRHIQLDRTKALCTAPHQVQAPTTQQPASHRPQHPP